jgi:YD repeat-containing protein
LSNIDYSDSTPDVSYTYDRLGRRQTTVANGMTTTWTYNDANQPLTEGYSGGTLAGLSVNWSYHTNLGLQTVEAKNGSTVLQSASYGYDTVGRLGTVTDGSYSATYAYQDNSMLVGTLTSTNSGGAGLVTSRVYDWLNRLQKISSQAYSSGAAVGLPVGVSYQHNAANQRTRATTEDRSYWVYQYDALGQVISGQRFWSDGSPVAG